MYGLDQTKMNERNLQNYVNQLKVLKSRAEEKQAEDFDCEASRLAVLKSIAETFDTSLDYNLMNDLRIYQAEGDNQLRELFKEKLTHDSFLDKIVELVHGVRHSMDYYIGVDENGNLRELSSEVDEYKECLVHELSQAIAQGEELLGVTKNREEVRRKKEFLRLFHDEDDAVKNNMVFHMAKLYHLIQAGFYDYKYITVTLYDLQCLEDEQHLEYLFLDNEEDSIVFRFSVEDIKYEVEEMKKVINKDVRTSTELAIQKYLTGFFNEQQEDIEEFEKTYGMDW